METLPSTWKLDDTRRNLEALIMNGTLQNFNNLRAERQENYDKRKKSSKLFIKVTKVNILWFSYIAQLHL
jgi:hypothetical protein